jgi:23S rRNA (guanosine2251-2'-O)-methyltransferase
MNNFPNEPRQQLIYGMQPLLEAFKSGQQIDKILMLRNLKTDEALDIMDMAAERRVPISMVPIEKLNQITRKNHQGVIAFMAAVDYASIDMVLPSIYETGRMPLLLILDRITDVRNFGAICRTAECAGVDAVVVPMKGAAQVGPDAMKTSAGALSHIPVCREKNLLHTLFYLQESGLQLVACSEKGKDSIYEVDYKQPTAIIMGSEEDGISTDILRITDRLVQIPMHGRVASLNVSVAAGAILFESVRQRGGF